MTLWSAHLFSEGTTLHLWQIRHIPKRPQTLLNRTFSVAAWAFVFVSHLTTTRYATAQPANSDPKKAAAVVKSTAATEFFDRVRQELPKHSSVKADLSQVVSIGDQRFKVSGQYASAGKKLSLHYVMTPDQGASCEMLEVCDGKELWTMMSLPPEPKRVTHRNVEQIQAAVAANSQRGILESQIPYELGLGGLNALLASLDRKMTFDALKEEESDGRMRTIVQARWKKDVAQLFPKEKDDSLPAFVPDLVRIYVDSKTLFPERVLYLKKFTDKEKKTFRPVVDVEFRNVELDGPVDEKLFEFKIDPDVVPEDVTKMYLDRISAPAEGATPKK